MAARAEDESEWESPSRVAHSKVLVAEILSLTVHPTCPPCCSSSFSSLSVVSCVEILGTVVSVDDQRGFVLDDGTGRVACVLGRGYPSTPALERRQARPLRAGAQLRVRGRLALHVRSGERQIKLKVRDALPEADPHAKTFHLLHSAWIALRRRRPPSTPN